MKANRNQARKAKGARYTKPRRPVELVGITPEMIKSEALKPEYRIKQLPADNKKAELTRKENEMTILKKDLQALNKDIQALGKTIDKLIAAVEKGETTKVAKKTTAKPIKAKTTKRSPEKKAPVKRRTAKVTATDQVLKIIMGRKRGVDVATLVKKTGFDLKKVRNILHRTYKMGKIKRVAQGIYVGA